MSPIRLRVAELRADRGWTQQELADRAKVTRVTITRIERDSNRRIDYETLERIADAFGCDAGYLLVHERKGKR